MTFNLRLTAAYHTASDGGGNTVDRGNLRTSQSKRSRKAAHQHVSPLSVPERFSNTSRYFLWASDIHLDPYYGTPEQQCGKSLSVTKSNAFGTMGCDPPFALLESGSAALADLASSVDAEFFMFTGDFVRHNPQGMPTPASSVKEAISNITGTFNASMPMLHGYSVGALGNDDSPRDYKLNITTSQASNPWLEQLANIFATNKQMPLKYLDAYSYGGFFESEIGGIKVLTLNTLFYSVFHNPVTYPLPEDPFGQFSWLREKLTLAAQQQRAVWIVGHIPPGLETYGYTELWHPQYLTAYLDIVQDPNLGKFVAAQLFGHCHTDEFRLLPNAPDGAGPILLNGALSPIYGNQPSIRLVEYEPSTGRMVSYNVYWSELTEGSQEPAWHFGYNAVTSYKSLRESVKATGALSQSSFEALANVLETGLGSEWDTYVTWYRTRSANDLEDCGVNPPSKGQDRLCSSACLVSYACGIRIYSEQDYKTCKRQSLADINMKETADATNSDPSDFYKSEREKHRDALRLPGCTKNLRRQSQQKLLL